MKNQSTFLFLFAIVFTLVSCEKQNDAVNVPVQEDANAAKLLKATPPPSVVTSNFDGVNWADQRDNYVNGWLYPGGLASTMTYADVIDKGGKIIDGFKTNTGANTVRLPINPETVTQSWWASYMGAIDVSLTKGMKVILCCWEGVAVKDGKIDDMTAFNAMWDVVIAQYGTNPNVYFEIFNEPFGYTQSAWATVCANWLARYPALNRGNILVGGHGYDENVTLMGADTRFANCLLSQHIYSWWGNYNSEPRWKTELQNRVGTYYGRTILTEFGATMTTGKNYGAPKKDVEISFIRGITDQIRTWGMGSCYWPGLRIADTYTLQTLNTTTYVLTNSNVSGKDRIRFGWGL